jgi:hypothetical protein
MKLSVKVAVTFGTSIPPSIAKKTLSGLDLIELYIGLSESNDYILCGIIVVSFTDLATW